MKKKLHCCIPCCLFILLLPHYLSAQTPNIDSLTELLGKHPQQDTARANLLNQLAFEYKNVDPERSMSFAKQALELARTLNFPEAEPKALRTMGSYYYQQGDYSNALQSFEQSRLAAIRVRDTLTQAWALNGKGTIFHSQSNYPQALDFYLQAVQLFEKSGRHKEAASIMGNAGVLFKELGEFTSALNYFERGLKIQEQRQDNNEIARFLNNIGGVYSDLKKYKEAGKAYNRGLALAQSEGNTNLEALLLRNLTEVEQHQKDYSKAFAHGFRSLALYKSLGATEGIADASYRMALLYFETKQIDSALYFGNQALSIADKIGFKRNIFYTYDVLAKAYAEKQMYRQAYEAQQLYISYKDSLVGEDKQNMVAGLKFQYELDKKQTEIELLTKEKQFQLEKASNQRTKVYALLAGLLLVGSLAVILVKSNRRKQKDNAILLQQKEDLNAALTELKSTQSQLIQREKMASLGELTAGIAHEIQNPLNFVNNFSDVSSELVDEMQPEIEKGNIEEMKAIAASLKENLLKITHHGKRADAIVRGMLLHSRNNSGSKEPTNINALADEYLRLSYHGLRAKDKSFNATLETHFDESIGRINLVPQEMGRVMLNLFNNAFYSITDKKKLLGEAFEPLVTVTTKKLSTPEGTGIQICVRDNGVGIPQKLLDKIFQPFFTTKPTGQGTGLGLSLSYDLVKAHGGALKVETKEGEYAEFIIDLPMS